MSDAKQQTLDALLNLGIRIGRSGPPPHTDFWHQSITEAQAAVVHEFEGEINRLRDEIAELTNERTGLYKIIEGWQIVVEMERKRTRLPDELVERLISKRHGGRYGQSDLTELESDILAWHEGQNATGS